MYESICELQDDIYSDRCRCIDSIDDSWLKLVQLNKLDAILDDALKVTWNMIYKKNRISLNKINKDTDGYVSKLAHIINNKNRVVE